jgi:hypothetical protein
MAKSNVFLMPVRTKTVTEVTFRKIANARIAYREMALLGPPMCELKAVGMIV